MKRHYQTLGLPMGASRDEIGKAFRAMAKRFYPNHNPNDPAAAEHFKRIAAAYTVLMSQAKTAPEPSDIMNDDMGMPVWLVLALWPLVWLPWLYGRRRGGIGTSS